MNRVCVSWTDDLPEGVRWSVLVADDGFELTITDQAPGELAALLRLLIKGQS